MKIKISIFSDTHGYHDIWHKRINDEYFGKKIKNDWNESDVLLFAGDCTGLGHRHEVKQFLKWFNRLHHNKKIMISGNHDFFFDYDWKPYTIKGNSKHGFRLIYTKDDINSLLSEFNAITYLDDSLEIFKGLKIWGTPVQPWFHDWAFNRERGADIIKHWELIPGSTDILIVHGPPYKILDRVNDEYIQYNEEPNVGDKDLNSFIDKIKPKLVAFGHIHESYGKLEKNGTIFCNASSLDYRYRPVNPPITLDLDI